MEPQKCRKGILRKTRHDVSGGCEGIELGGQRKVIEMWGESI